MALFHAWAVRPEPTNYIGIFEADSEKEVFDEILNPLPQDVELQRVFRRSLNIKRMSPIVERIPEHLDPTVE